MTDQWSIRGGFTDGWLEFGDDVDEEEQAVQTAALSSLRDELSLVSNAENLVVLAGSGASFGIQDILGDYSAPSMRTLWNDVAGLPSFADARRSLNPDLIADEHLEHVLSDAQARLALNPDDAALSTFIKEAEEVVWTKCSFVDDSSDLGAHELFLRKVARRSTRHQRAQIFTTNYDLAFEEAARRARFNVIDGFAYGGQDFDGASFDLDYVRRRPHEPLTLEPSVFHLLKLHGSVDWTSAGGGVRKIFGGIQPPDPVLIYPSATKYQMSYQQPYLEFMSRFQIALRQPDVGLIVVGFGFNDDHISAPIEAALRSNVGLRAVFVSPGIRDDNRSDRVAWIEQLVHKGDRRITLMEATFDGLVKHLPDAPLREERDVHADRFSRGGTRN